MASYEKPVASVGYDAPEPVSPEEVLQSVDMHRPMQLPKSERTVGSTITTSPMLFAEGERLTCT